MFPMSLLFFVGRSEAQCRHCNDLSVKRGVLDGFCRSLMLLLLVYLAVHSLPLFALF